MRLLSSVSLAIAATIIPTASAQQARIQTYHYDQKDCSNPAAITETQTVTLDQCYTDADVCRQFEGVPEAAMKTRSAKSRHSTFGTACATRTVDPLIRSGGLNTLGRSSVIPLGLFKVTLWLDSAII